MRWRAERWMKLRHMPAAFLHSPRFVLRHGRRMLAHTFAGTTVRSLLGLESQQARVRALSAAPPAGAQRYGVCRLIVVSGRRHRRKAGSGLKLELRTVGENLSSAADSDAAAVLNMATKFATSNFRFTDFSSQPAQAFTASARGTNPTKVASCAAKIIASGAPIHCARGHLLSSTARTPPQPPRRHQGNDDGAARQIAAIDDPRFRRSKRRRRGIVGVAPDSGQLREHVVRVSVRKRGPQRGSVRIPHPHDQADRIENLGGALQQRRHVAWIHDPAEFGAQMCGSCKVWLPLERPRSPSSRRPSRSQAVRRETRRCKVGARRPLSRHRGCPLSRLRAAAPRIAVVPGRRPLGGALRSIDERPPPIGRGEAASRHRGARRRASMAVRVDRRTAAASSGSAESAFVESRSTAGARSRVDS